MKKQLSAALLIGNLFCITCIYTMEPQEGDSLQPKNPDEILKTARAKTIANLQKLSDSLNDPKKTQITSAEQDLLEQALNPTKIHYTELPVGFLCTMLRADNPKIVQLLIDIKADYAERRCAFDLAVLIHRPNSAEIMQKLLFSGLALIQDDINTAMMNLRWPSHPEIIAAKIEHLKNYCALRNLSLSLEKAPKSR